MAILTANRECGSCNACCKPFTVPEVGKNDGGWCRHSIKGQGCGIYKDRPPACSQFKCIWLHGHGPDEDRPDKVGFLVTLGPAITLRGKLFAHFAFFETYPGGIDTNRAQEYVGNNIEGMRIVTEARMTGESSYSLRMRYSEHFSADDVRSLQEQFGKLTNA